MFIKRKPLITTLALSLSLAVLSNSVFAGDYTSSDSNKNSSYNRGAATWYATTYVYSPNPSYINFMEFGGDCTNFASQVLNCGGMSEVGTNRDSIYSWFYNGAYPNYSSTWTGAHQFISHWGNVNDIGNNRAYSYKIYTSSDSALNDIQNIYNRVGPGDIIQYADENGQTWHSQVVYAKYPTGEIRMAQHSDNSIDFTYKWLHEYLDATGYTYIFVYEVKNSNS